MPLKLIGTIILLIIVTVFAGINMDNKCDINFLFKQLEQVPVFATVIISFAAGAVVMLPFTLGLGRKKKSEKKEKPSKEVQKASETADKSGNAVVEPVETTDNSKTLFDFKIKKDASKQNKPKKSFFAKKEKKPEETPAAAESTDSTVAPSN
ncbi:MAG: DUF1049 domain-containing protein [Treponema sp.]|nr:DUF1049 domain-containing protein [Candidatus Treponema equifaecale]